MPELPDVATFERYLDATALHEEIVGVGVRDARLLAELSASELERALVGRSFAATRRHGKHLFVLLDGERDGALTLHFGMTGTLRSYRRADKEPDRARVEVSGRAAYLCPSCQRRLGEGEARDGG